MKKSSFLRRVSVLLSLALIMTLVAPMPAMAASGGKLLKSVKEYQNYKQYNNGKIVKSKYQLYRKTNFKLNKSYPNEIKNFNYGSEAGFVNTLKYKMKKNKPKSMKLKNSINKFSTKYKYDKKGRVTKSTYTSYFKREKTTNTYKYNKKGFVTSHTYKYSYKNMWGTYSSNETDVYKYAFKMKKGLPKELTTTYTSSYSSKDTQDPDDSYSGKSGPYTYFATFNGKGLITSAGSIYDKERYVRYVVKYKTKKGKVTSAIVYYVEERNDNGTPKKLTPERKYTFSYAKDKASKGRYANMINSQLGFGREYGSYNWY